MNCPTPTTPRFNPGAPRGARRSQVCSVNSGSIAEPLRLDGNARRPTAFFQNTMMDSGKHRDLPTLQIEEGTYFTRLTMPYDGVVRKILAKVGGIFAKDVILAEIEAP